MDKLSDKILEFLGKDSAEDFLVDVTIACYYGSVGVKEHNKDERRELSGSQKSIIYHINPIYNFAFPQSGNQFNTMIGAIFYITENNLLSDSAMKLLVHKRSKKRENQPFYTKGGLTETGKEFTKYLLKCADITQNIHEAEIRTAMACMGVIDFTSPIYDLVKKQIKEIYHLKINDL